MRSRRLRLRLNENSGGPHVQQRRVKHLVAALAPSYSPHAKSWYIGANSPGKLRIFMAYVRRFWNRASKCNEIADKG